MKFVNSLLLTLFLGISVYGQSGSAGCLDFSGNSYVDLSSHLDQLVLPVTVTAWIKVSPSSSFQPIFSSNSDLMGYSAVWCQIRANRLQTSYGTSSGYTPSNRRTKNSNLTNQSNEWQHVAFVLTSALDMENFLNGVNLGGTYAGSGGAYYNNPGGIGSIGRTKGGTWTYFNGEIDELAVWSTALSQIEIRNLMTKSLSGNESNLSALYKMDGTGNTCTDSGSNNYNGTLQNGPTRITSGAAIGDTSYYSYSSTNITQFSTTLSNGTQINVSNINPAVPGVQVYEVQQAPNTTQGIPSTVNVQDYFGVYLAKTSLSTNYTFDLEIINAGSGAAIYGREDNATTSWQSKTVTFQGTSAIVSGVSNRHEFVIDPGVPLSCFADEEYDQASVWLTANNGTEVVVSGGQLRFQDATDGSSKRVYKQLDQPVDDTQCWEAKFDLNLVQGGVNNAAGHIVLALTNGNDCPYNNCTDVNTNFSFSNEKGIMLTCGTPRNGGQPSLLLRSKNGSTVNLSNPIQLSWGSQYYITISKQSSNQAVLTVFSDNARTQQIGLASTVSLPTGIGSLNYIQHSTLPQGHPDRRLTAQLDNFCLDTLSQCCNFSFSLGSDTTICVGDSLVLGRVRNTLETYQWNTNTNNDFITVKDSGYYVLEIDSNGCAFTDSIKVNFYPKSPFQISGDLVFCDSTDLSIPAGYTNINWSVSGNFNSQATVDQGGIVFVSAQDANTGCTFYDTVLVQKLDINTFGRAFPRDTLICGSTSITLDASGNSATSYVWNDGTTAAIRQFFTSGKYWVKRYFGNDCYRTDTIDILFSRVQDPMLNAQYYLCDGLVDVSLPDPSPYASVNWSNGGGTSTGQTFTNSGTFSVTLTNADGCDISRTFDVNQAAVTQNNYMFSDTTLCDGNSLFYQQPTGLTYTWRDGFSGSREISMSGYYGLEVSDSCGSEEVFFDVQAYDCDCELFIPNAFTPNSDGRNDAFTISSRCHFGAYKLQVYSRWGQLLFESHSVDEPWDGRFKGRNLAEGVYYFNLRYTNAINNSEHQELGYITLFR
jgi:gliding motility-associated-like protein